MQILNHEQNWTIHGYHEDITLRLGNDDHDQDVRTSIFGGCTAKLPEKDNGSYSYTFNVTAPSAQINFADIAKDLTAKNPIALVEVEGDEWVGYVVVHVSLAMKASVVHDLDTDTSEEYIWHKCKNAREFSEYVADYRSVQSAPWPKDVVSKSKVSVSFPSL